LWFGNTNSIRSGYRAVERQHSPVRQQPIRRRFRRMGWNPDVELRQITAVTTASGFSENCHD
jgi:hypothetical protein